MAIVLLPRSLLALFPGVERRHEVDGATVETVLSALDAQAPGMRDRLVEAGPRLRPHINVFVDGRQADLSTPVAAGSTVHVIPAVSGGSPGRQLRSKPASGSNASVRSATTSPPIAR